jgi:cyclopropane fatty-acyl-phospholipid synthase-like methyltransferase
MPTYFDHVAQNWDQDQTRHDRAQAVAAQLHAQIKFTPTMTVLEFGCGTGLLGFNLLPDVAALTFADSSAGMLAQVQQKITAQQLPHADTLLLTAPLQPLPRQYDVIVSLLTLHHIADYRATLRWLVQHLQPQGYLAIADLDSEDGSFHDKDQPEHHGFTRADLRQVFTDCGLTNLADSTPYIIKKLRSAIWQTYPLFLMTGQRQG